MVDSSDNVKQWENHKFETPIKSIKTIEDVEIFKKSKIYVKLMTFICDLQKSVEGKPFSVTKPDPKFQKLVDFLEDLEKLIEEIPPLKQPMRFGNKAFRTWYDRVGEKADKLFQDILIEKLKGASVELKVYLNDSFGSYERIDYGTGHELAFTFFLLCLFELGFYTKSDFESMLRNVFYKYIKLMRKLQLTYMLEPAGSHGVWGLDDYHFLPFLYGASELLNNVEMPKPDIINQEGLINKYCEEYIYLGCIKFIKEAKKGTPFYECSPILNDISAAASWQKVANGLVKMFQAEVLFKHPVIKHSFFGTIIQFK